MEESNEEPKTLGKEEEEEEVKVKAEEMETEEETELADAPAESKSEADDADADADATASASANANDTTTDEPTSSRGKRIRKSIQNFNPEEYDTQKKEIEIPSGRGVKLSDMPNVVENFKAVTWSDPHLKMLHTLIFGGKGKKKEFKAHLLQFNGVVYPDGKDVEEERTKLREKMYKLTMPELLAVMDLVDVPRSASSFGLEKGKNPAKEEYCTRFLEWLEEPAASGNKRKEPASSSKKRKSTGSTTSGSSKKSSSTEKKKSPSTQKKKAAATTTPKSKASAPKATKPKSSKKADDDDEGEVNINIPGVDIDKLREKVRSIVSTGNRDTLSVKSIRSMLEEWLDTDLNDHKDAIRTIVMDEL